MVIDSLKTRYWSAGRQGSPVLLLHGIGAFSETWLPTFHALAEHHRVFAVDLPGHGLTNRYTGSHTIEYFAQFIDAFITAQNLDRVHLIGNSFGGGVALQYAMRYPEKTEKIVLAANPGFGRELSFPLRLVGIPLFGKIFIRSRKSEASRRKRSVAILKGILHDVDHVDAATREILLDMYTRMGAKQHGGWAVYEILRRYTNLLGIKKSFMGEFNRIVRDVEAPALIIWGENDRVIPPEHGTMGLKLLRLAKLHTIRDCGHMPQLEHPHEFNRVILEFLKS
jgi:4,5:9,10-diseco-3-hydroxy-5,9,17-trioxoandrosta-1(10),2-diene-4-oate hydrolase